MTDNTVAADRYTSPKYVALDTWFRNFLKDQTELDVTLQSLSQADITNKDLKNLVDALTIEERAALFDVYVPYSIVLMGKTTALTDVMKVFSPEGAYDMLNQIHTDLARILYLLVREVKVL